ncbi:MAG: hypothetical protein GF320_14505 [Armatimonadia bacterium]|nr:hypothetical protein [Armatimonadia bacterium]
MNPKRSLWHILLLAAIACILAAGCGQNLSQSSAPYNQGSTSGADRFGRDVRPGESVARDGTTVGGATLMMGIKVTGSDLEDSDMEFSGNPSAFAEWADTKGFDAIGLYAVEPTDEPDQVATFYFPDVEFPTGKNLSDLGYAAGPDHLTPLVQAAKSLGMGTQADLTRLALSLPSSPLAERPFAGEPLTADDIEYLCSYLLETTDVDSLSARGFPKDWVDAAQKASEAAGRQFFAGDYQTLRRTESGAAALLDLGPEGMARNELALGVARSKPFLLYAGLSAERDDGRGPFADAWDSIKAMEAALVYRTVLSAPQGLYLDVPPSVLQDLDPDLLARLKRVAAQRRARPVCNVLILGDSTPNNLTAVVNGITAAGYDIVMGPRPESPAAIDAYYIIVTETTEGSLADPKSGLPDGVYNSGKPLIMQVCGLVPDVGVSESWDAVRRSFGLTNLPFEPLEKGPEAAVYAGGPVPCAATGRAPWGSKITDAHLSEAVPLAVGAAKVEESVDRPASEGAGDTDEPDDTGEAADADDTDAGDDAAEAGARERSRDVIVMTEFSYGTAGRNVLIAGRELQMEMAFPISNVLSSGLGLQAPTRALVSVGSPIALYAPFGDAEVSIAYNDAGEVKSETKSLKKGSVEIIEVDLQTGVNTMPLPDRVSGE